MFYISILIKLFIKKKFDKDSFLNYHKYTLDRRDGLAVILIDMQRSFIKNLNKKEKNHIILNQILMIRWCAQRDIPIIVLEYEGYEKTINILTKELQKVKNLTIIKKSHDDGFLNTELDDVLKKIGTKNLFLMGINAGACVIRTAQGAIKKGYFIITSDDVINGNRDNLSWYERNGVLISLVD